MSKSFLGYGWLVPKEKIAEDDRIYYMDCDDEVMFCGFIVAECGAGKNIGFVPSAMMKQIEDSKLQVLRFYEEISGDAADCRPNLILINKEV